MMYFGEVSILKGLKITQLVLGDCDGNSNSKSISLIESNSEILLRSQARLMAEGHWGLDWEVTDSIESLAVI